MVRGLVLHALLVSGLLATALGLKLASPKSPVNVPFVKYQGLGNDFILIDNTRSSSPIYTPEDAVKLCDRNFGIGL